MSVAMPEYARPGRQAGRRARRSRPRVAAAAALIAAAWLSGALRAAEPAQVSFAARDGQQVTGALFLPDRKPAPAVILLPMMTRTHVDWDVTAARLAEAGIAALAIDFRRGGAPRTDPSADPAAEPIGDCADLALDVEAAHAFLAARADIAAGRIGIGGASIGANVAAIVAAEIPAVRSIALLSPSLEYRGLRVEAPMRKFAHRPAFIIVSDDDPYAMRSGKAIATYGDGHRDLRVVSGAGHGTVMLTRQPDLIAALVDWFLRTLV
jgi:dienelactone hydrolase